jgi:ComF family protein
VVRPWQDWGTRSAREAVKLGARWKSAKRQKPLIGTMASAQRAQYIEPMVSLLRPFSGPPGSPGLLRWLGRWRWPTQCLVCHLWQQEAICADCRKAFARQVPRCPRCALPLPHGHPKQQVCGVCEDYPPEFDRAVAALDYTAPWTPLIAQLKFQQSPALARPLGHLLAEAVRAHGRVARRTVVLAAPLSETRLHERGYNQAALLARQLAAELQLTCLPEALVKRTHTARMMSLSSDERLVQIRGAFEVSPRFEARLAGQDVALVDDVMTTGATLNELTRTLRDAGVCSVSAWVLARTPPPKVGAQSPADAIWES